MKDLHEQIAKLTPEKRALLEQRLVEQGLPLPNSGRIERRQSGEPSVLSHAQQRLWFIQQFDPQNTAYNICAALRLTGLLDTTLLVDALNKITERHESLRTSFLKDTGGQAFQKVHPHQRLEVPTVDISTGADSDRTLKQRIKQLSAQPFDLTKPPLRIELLKLSDEDHILALITHHIVCDRWSVMVFLRELASYYSEQQLPQLPIQYTDWAHWQRQQLQGPRLKELLDYWKTKLAGPLPETELPIAGSHLENQSSEHFPISLGPVTSSQLKKLAHDHQVSLFTVLLAAFKIFLHRYSGTCDIVVGSEVANRDRTETAGLIGLLVNTLVLRTDLSGNPTFGELAGRVHQTVSEGLTHKDLPFENLVETLNPERDLDQLTPLFQVKFDLQQVPIERQQLAGLALQRIPVEDLQTKYALRFNLQESERGIDGQIEFSSGLFDRQTIAQMAKHYENLLGEILANPSHPISQYQIISAPERAELIKLSQGPVSPGATGTLYELFEQQVHRQPNNVAVIEGDKHVTYGDLKKIADDVCCRLRDIGIGHQQRVAVSIRKSAKMVASMLGILKAGGAYVAIDPEYPEERKRYILEDSRCRVLCDDTGIQILSGGKSDDATRTTPKPSHDSLAYILYTSGSTGRPKGVAIEHRSVVALLNWARDQYSQEQLAGVLASTSICFDLSVFEIFVPLAWGGSVIVAENLFELHNLPARHQVTLINTVPSLLRQLLAGGELPESVQTVNLAGEALPHDLVATLQARKIEHIYNLYGPSEDTTYSTCAALDARCFDPAADKVHIGKPIANTHAYVLDSQLRLQPIGVAGELYLGGAGLARGYLDRPKLTDQCFIPNPISNNPPTLYRTGDRVRLREDGNLEFLSRLDDQFKIRGFRIEAGEVESLLRAHPEVEDAVVVAHDTEKMGDEKEKVLLAYLVSATTPDQKVAVHERQNEAQLTSALRQYLAEQLPSAMVPTLWQLLPQIPRLPNGKVDRRQLPQPQGLQVTATYVAPTSEIEQTLAKLWQELLKQTKVGIHDNFFELGGHSLLAIQLVTQMQGQFGIEFPLRKLFEMPTVAQLATYIDEQTDSPNTLAQTHPAALFDLRSDPNNRHEPFTLTDLQQAFWLGRSGAFELGNIATHGYREIETSGVSHAAIQAAFNQLIKRHDMLRVVVNSDGLQRCLEQVPEYEIALQESKQLDDVDAYRESRRKELSHQVLSPESWPLFHVEALSLDNDRTIYFVSFDVLLGDAWSLQILGREMAQLLRGVTLPPLELSFRDYVLAERTFISSPRYREAWDYWQQRAATLPPAPELPLIKSTTELNPPQFVRRSHRLPIQQWNAIKRHAQRLGLTASGIVLAAFTEVLGTWSRRRHFTLNLTLFNRPPIHPAIDQLVGDFTSSLLLEVNQCNGLSFADRARRLQANLWEVLEQRAVSGVRVIRELARRRQLGTDAIMPVVFTSTLGKIVASSAAKDKQASVTYALSQTSQVYLDHQVSEIDGELILNWDSIDELFPPGVLDEMFSTYSKFLSELADNALRWTQRPQLIQQATIAEQPGSCQQQTPANNLSLLPAEGRLLYQPFFEQALKQPSSPAVITDEFTLSYGELASATVQLADRLSKHNVKPNEFVAVCMPKGWQQVVACLAIQVAGGAYVPIDAKLPQSRRHQMLQDTYSRLVLTTAQSPADWPDVTIQMRIESSATQQQPLHLPEPQQQATDLAYVIFTSGSTGRPKGVMIDHRGAANTILDINERIQLQPTDRVFALSSLSFDLSVYDLFGTLAAGAAIVIGDDSTKVEDPQYWLKQVARHQVTVWNSVPALMQLFVDTLQKPTTKQHSPPLRTILLSGDWIPPTLPTDIKRHLPEATTISLGGATEASIWSIAHTIDIIDPDWPSIPYGSSLTNQTWYILDENLDPRPPWVPGELYVGGQGVAQGYWNRPTLTAENFLPNPFSDNDHPYLYRTGDWGRLRPHQPPTQKQDPPQQIPSHAQTVIEFLGREDQQVKINGYRIELGEIEAAITEHPSIDHAVVSTFGSPPELIAYVVLNQSSTAAPNHLLRRLQLKSDKQNQTPAQLDGIPLPPVDETKSFFRRQSHRQFLSDTIPAESFGSLLASLAAKPDSTAQLRKYRYPSAGSLYPVKTYISVKQGRVEGIPSGWYCYDSQGHQLQPIDASIDSGSAQFYDTNKKTFQQSAFGLFFVADFKEIQQIYEERARDFCLLEAGYMGQLLMQKAPDLELGLCPVNDREFETLVKHLELDPSHNCLHGMLGGRIDPAWSDRWMAAREPDNLSFQEQLQAYLQNQLPKYMVPNRFQVLDHLPLSANGKVDRNALPAPNTPAENNYVPPTSELEKTITNLWQQLLAIEQVGIHDNFFQLGGNSLQAIQLLGHLRETCHVEVTMEQLFGALTPAEQAEMITSLQSSTKSSTTIPQVPRTQQPLDQISDAEVDTRLQKLLSSKNPALEKTPD